jgi:hypothetical protein
VALRRHHRPSINDGYRPTQSSSLKQRASGTSAPVSSPLRPAANALRTAHRARENRLARYGTPESPRTPRFDLAFNRADYSAPRAPRASPTRKKAPAHKAAGANGTTTT